MDGDINTAEVYDSLDAELLGLLETSENKEKETWRRDFTTYRGLFYKFLHSKPTIEWEKIEPLPDGCTYEYDSLAAPSDLAEIRQLLSKVVIIKLNGGLGTTMGCRGPKSLITVRNGRTFLDFTVMQVDHLNKSYGVDVPLVLMNSFNTEDDTEKVLRLKYRRTGVKIHSFNQSRCPRINRETQLPIITDLTENDPDAWYPPGHGDLLRSISNCGKLEELLNNGKEYCFVSNIDNTGATLDLKILNFLLSNGADERPEYLMEVTEKTPSDIKGGTLIQYEGRLLHLEMPQVPKDHIEDFKSITQFKIFNTNNIWISLPAIKRFIDEGHPDLAEIIVNPKHLSSGIDVIQLETSIGGAIKNFGRSCCVSVPRSRFLPVKKTQDLLVVMSNLCEVNNGRIQLNSKRSFPSLPVVKLGSSFDHVQEFLTRFKGVPDMLALNHLTVSGDVWFGKGIALKGTVIIIANPGERIDLADDQTLENKIVSGNLRILDH